MGDITYRPAIIDARTTLGFPPVRAQKANNPKINFVVIPSCKKAAIEYGGYSNERIEKKKILELKKTLQENNINHDEKFEVLVYNSPYKILNRHFLIYLLEITDII